MNERTLLNNTIVKNLMLEVLEDKEFCKEHSGGYNFLDAGGAHQDNLFEMVERMAVKKGLIKKEVDISRVAWGAGKHNLCEGYNTNFKIKEIEYLWETFHLFLNNGVLSPGWYRNSPNLPFFHVTNHGKKCIGERNILPYDIDGYMERLICINGIDEWVKFYTLEALRCYNSNCYNASAVMIGLASETLVELMIKEFICLCEKKNYEANTELNKKISNTTVVAYLEKNIKEKTPISTKYVIFEEVFNGIKNMDSELKRITDTASRSTFINCLRVNRNEVAHPGVIKKDESEVLLLFIGFIKYCEMMTKMIVKMRELNN